MKHFNILLMGLIACVMLSCSKSSDTAKVTTDDGSIDNLLHLAFKTPDWERKIDCTLLDLDGVALNDSTLMVSAESASTKEVFYFSYPRDSSSMVKAANLKKYPIVVTGANYNKFEFSQKLPLTDGSSVRLISEAGLSAASYNEVAEIKYVGRVNNQAQFQVKCRYAMMMHDVANDATKKSVTGTFHFKIKARSR